MYSFNHIISGDYTSSLKDLLWICQYMETTSQLVFLRIFLFTMFTFLCLHCRTAVLLLVPQLCQWRHWDWGAHYGVLGFGYFSFWSCCILALTLDTVSFLGGDFQTLLVSFVVASLNPSFSAC